MKLEVRNRSDYHRVLQIAANDPACTGIRMTPEQYAAAVAAGAGDLLATFSARKPIRFLPSTKRQNNVR